MKKCSKDINQECFNELMFEFALPIAILWGFIFTLGIYNYKMP